jgi:hypothetical protein
MDSHVCSPTAASCRSVQLAPAGFRVIARRKDRSEALVTLAATLRQAVTLAMRFRDAEIAFRTRRGSNGKHLEGEVVALRIEEWWGTLTEGYWRSVSQTRGGFWYRFNSRNSRNGKPRNPSLPKSGDKVQCILLAEKTRKNGWLARLVPQGASGPITNTADVPASMKPGQTVTLRIGVISEDGKRVQFRWQIGDNADEG